MRTDKHPSQIRDHQLGMQGDVGHVQAHVNPPRPQLFRPILVSAGQRISLPWRHVQEQIHVDTTTGGIRQRFYKPGFQRLIGFHLGEDEHGDQHGLARRANRFHQHGEVLIIGQIHQRGVYIKGRPDGLGEGNAPIRPGAGGRQPDHEAIAHNVSDPLSGSAMA